ncbi:MAG: hypothetical protein QOF50_823 [Gaiellaceae bacterium]|jgi:hypothetical protein|nr:hypothetical protein [Gaiellaceae bacterium]
MGRPRKHPREWTTEQAIHKLFPKRVVKELKRGAKEANETSEKPITKPDST